MSVIAVVLGFYAFAFLPEHSYRLHQQGAAFLTQAAIAVVLGLCWCAFTLLILLRDNRSGYPSMRCSLATFLWSLACLPVLFLTVVVIGGFFR